jgi:hypothetical protein
MKLGGLHLLVTYQCNRECDHCFVWGGPWQKGAMTIAQVDDILRQAKETGTVTGVWFEGGEPMLYYPVVLEGVKRAVALGLTAGIVSNAYWARTKEDAVLWLAPFKGLLNSLLISCDPMHWHEDHAMLAANAGEAVKELGMPLGVLAIPDRKTGTVPGVMYRGRAAEKLAPRAETRAWEGFTACTPENLREPVRIHVDYLGNLHACQGVIIGNLFRKPLKDICAEYDPESHPIIGPLLRGGPAELARRLAISPAAEYADACQLCYETRRELLGRFPEQVGPASVYGGK